MDNSDSNFPDAKKMERNRRAEYAFILKSYILKVRVANSNICSPHGIKYGREDKTMLDKKLYERYLLKAKENTLAEKEMEGLNNDFMNIMIHYYIDKQYDELKKEINSAKRFRSLFEGYIINYLSYQIGCFSTVVKIFELLIKSNIHQNNFKKTMTALYAKSGVAEILEYIYKNPDSQHKVICQKTSVKNKSYLSQLLKQLESAGCIERYSMGKTSFFSLSVEGQAFIKEKRQTGKIGEHILPVGKYDLSYLDNLQSDIDGMHLMKYSKNTWDKKYKNYVMEVNCVGKN